MRRLTVTLSLLLSSLAFAGPTTDDLLVGQFTYLGVITATTAKDNSDTAVPFTINRGNVVMVQCDVASYVYLPKTAAAASSTNGLKIQAGEVKQFRASASSTPKLSVIPVSGTANCKVWRME